MDEFARVAQIVSTVGRYGSVVCRQAGTLPFLLCEGQTAYFVPPTLRGPNSAKVSRVKEVKPGAWEVALEGIESIDAAEKLVGSYCLIPCAQLPSFAATQEPSLVIGYAAVDEKWGEIGAVTDVNVNGWQSVIHIAGQQGNVLVPFVDEFIMRVDEENKTLYTAIPQSLLELNSSSDDVFIMQSERGFSKHDSYKDCRPEENV